MLDAAIVGMGNWGRRLVDSVQGSSDKVRFVAGTTRTLDKAAEYAAHRGIELRPDYRAILQDPTIEAVVLATPHSGHAEEVVQAALAGKHVFVEKPFTLDRPSAERAAQACIQAQRVLAVGFNRRFRPAVRELQRMVAAGELGVLLHLEAQWSGPPPPTRAPDSWRHDYRESPGGGMGAKGIHLLDTMMALAGLAESVFAHSDRRVDPYTDDVTSLLLRFSSGASGYIGTCLSTPDYWRLQALGSTAWAEIRDEHLLTVCRLGGGLEARHFAPTDIERAALEAFADAVRGRAAYPVSVEQAIRGSAAIAAIVASAASATPVDIAAPAQSSALRTAHGQRHPR
jgi:predicted dehydrogenase